MSGHFELIIKKWMVSKGLKALNFALEGAQQFPPSKGPFYEDNVNMYRKLAQGTRAKSGRYDIGPWKIVETEHQVVYALVDFSGLINGTFSGGEKKRKTD